jgi:hypothetical protein
MSICDFGSTLQSKKPYIMTVLEADPKGGNLPRNDSRLLISTVRSADQKLQDKGSHISKLPYELLEHIASYISSRKDIVE